MYLDKIMMSYVITVITDKLVSTEMGMYLDVYLAWMLHIIVFKELQAIPQQTFAQMDCK